MKLLTQIEGWNRYWRSATNADEVERQLRRLRWLEEFAFHCGPEITAEYFRALQLQIHEGEKKLAELRGETLAAHSAAEEELALAVGA